MKLEALNLIKEKAVPRSALDNSINYTNSKTTDKPRPDVLETIREENKGAKLDTKA